MPSVYSRIHQLTTNRGRPPGRYPVAKSTFERWVAVGIAPAPEKLGPNIRAWSNEVLDKWDAQRAAGVAVSFKPPAINPNATKISTRPDAKRPGRPRKMKVGE